jgi:hypothetical protein
MPAKPTGSDPVHGSTSPDCDSKMTLPEQELARWHDDVEALPQWEQRLEEYREALAVMRISASRF